MVKKLDESEADAVTKDADGKVCTHAHARAHTRLSAHARTQRVPQVGGAGKGSSGRGRGAAPVFARCLAHHQQNKQLINENASSMFVYIYTYTHVQVQYKDVETDGFQNKIAAALKPSPVDSEDKSVGAWFKRARCGAARGGVARAGRVCGGGGSELAAPRGASAGLTGRGGVGCILPSPGFHLMFASHVCISCFHLMFASHVCRNVALSGVSTDIHEDVAHDAHIQEIHGACVLCVCVCVSVCVPTKRAQGPPSRGGAAVAPQ